MTEPQNISNLINAVGVVVTLIAASAAVYQAWLARCARDDAEDAVTRARRQVEAAEGIQSSMQQLADGIREALDPQPGFDLGGKHLKGGQWRIRVFVRNDGQRAITMTRYVTTVDAEERKPGEITPPNGQIRPATSKHLADVPVPHLDADVRIRFDDADGQSWFVPADKIEQARQAVKAVTRG